MRGAGRLCFSAAYPSSRLKSPIGTMRFYRVSFAFLLCGLSALNQIRADVAELGLREAIESFSADRGDLNREYDVADSPAKTARFKQFYRQWQEKLSELDFDKLPQAGK